MKDNFSHNSQQYQSFRPLFPEEFIDAIVSHCPERKCALDVGTGNGQIAIQLSKHFLTVEAIDISQNQMNLAPKRSNIRYTVQSAEKTDFPDQFFDLVIAGQAAHWFDADTFYKEVNRILPADGIVALIGYGLVSVNSEVNEILDLFYRQIVGPYWDPERRHIDHHYRDLSFPFSELSIRQHQMIYTWSFDHLIGYLNTWSAIKNFIGKNNFSPLHNLIPKLREAWGNPVFREVSFPLFNRIGRK
ncbi:MAG: methyltransferase domain-containing protein [Saprospiraceae bacterium]|nr:methyltransferase domain-containing protein [Saprospiraceae bacterium]